MIKVEFKEESSQSDEYLRYAQLIINAFTKALDQNECSVKALVGIHEEIRDQKQVVEDLWEMTKTNNYRRNNNNRQRVPVFKDDYISDFIYDSNDDLSDDITENIKNRLKEKCIDCDYDWPKLSFEQNFRFSFDKLKASLNTYLTAFDKIRNPNFCQAAGLFDFSCLQDIIKLIALFLSVYSAIIAFRKISGISLQAFIRGVITGLLGQLVGGIRLQFDLSQTGLSCLINAIEQIASNLPDGQNLSGAIPTDWFSDDPEVNPLQDDGTYGTNAQKDGEESTNTIKIPAHETYIDENGVEQERVVGSTEVPGLPEENIINYRSVYRDNVYNPFSDEGMKRALADMSNPKNQNIVKQYTNLIKKDSEEYQKMLGNIFKYIEKGVNNVVADFNEEVAGIFGLVDYLQCEAGRTGTDFLEILEYLQQIINIVNLLSALAAVIAKKQVKKMCKSANVVAESGLSEEAKELILNEPHELDPTELLEEFLEKVVEETVDENDEIIPIIYDKPKESILPKLSLDTCNLNEFIEAHTADEIIRRVVDNIREEERNRRNKPFKTDFWRKPGLTPEEFNDSFGTYSPYELDDLDIVGDEPRRANFKDVILGDRWKFYPIQFVKPVFDLEKIKSDTQLEENDTNLSKNLDTSFGVKTILDFIYNNPTEIIDFADTSNKKKDPVIEMFKPNLQDLSQVGVTENANQSNLKNPKESKYRPDSASYQNICRDINDVLSVLENIKGK